MSKQKVKVLKDGDNTFYHFDKDTGFWGIPSIQHSITYPVAPNKIFKIKHNSLGNRDEELTKNNYKKTIIFMGGSHTWGAAVEQSKRYTDILKTQIPYNIINMGHCSLGLDQIYVAFKTKALSLKPNILVIEQYPWSIHRIINTYVNGFCRPFFSLDKDNKLTFNKVPKMAYIKFIRKIFGGYHDFKKEFLEYKTNLSIKNNYNPEIDPIFLLWHTRYYDYVYNLAEQIVKKIKKLCQLNKIKLLFLIGTVNQQLRYKSKTSLIDYDLPRKRFLEILNKNKIEYLDTLKTMLDNNKSSAPVAYDDGHINEKGNFIFYSLLKEFL